VAAPAAGRDEEPVVTVGIVILNWNNADDTISCIESVVSSRNRDFVMYVIDNASDDDSLPRLHGHLVSVVANTPFQLVELGPRANRGGIAGDLVLMRTERNLGYAGGNNIGIRQAMRDGCVGVWVLNNDTRIAADALDELLRVADRHHGAVGVCLVERQNRSLIQCVGGGNYNWWTTRTSLNGAGAAIELAGTFAKRRLDFVSGAAMYIPAETIHQVGELDERYFLYCEDLDFAERCRLAGRPLAIAPACIVEHRFGGSTGAGRSLGAKSPFALFYSARATMLLTRRFRPALLPFAASIRAGFGIALLLRGYGGAARATWRGVAAGLRINRAPQQGIGPRASQRESRP
jgi:GT2 family glycosyltransferase